MHRLCHWRCSQSPPQLKSEIAFVVDLTAPRWPLPLKGALEGGLWFRAHAILPCENWTYYERYTTDVFHNWVRSGNAHGSFCVAGKLSYFLLSLSATPVDPWRVEMCNHDESDCWWRFRLRTKLILNTLYSSTGSIATSYYRHGLATYGIDCMILLSCMRIYML